MRILKEQADFNKESSVYVGKINGKCTDQDIVNELHQLFLYNRTYRIEMQKWENKKNKNSSKGPVHPYFVLGVYMAKGAKRFAFVDFDCKEAAEVVIKAWNGKTMSAF